MEKLGTKYTGELIQLFLINQKPTSRKTLSSILEIIHKTSVEFISAQSFVRVVGE